MEVRSLAVEYRAILGPAGVDLWLQQGTLAANLVKAFGDLRHSVRFESKGSNPEDFQLALFLLEPGLTFRYRTDAILIAPLSEDAAMIQTPLAAAMTLTALEVMKATAPEAEVTSQRVFVNTHADIDPLTVQGILDRHVSAPEPFRPLSLSLVRELGNGVAGTAFIEYSSISPRGSSNAFIQVTTTFPPSEAPSSIQERTAEFHKDALRMLLGEEGK